MISFVAFVLAVICSIFATFNDHIPLSGSAPAAILILLFISIGLLFAYSGPAWEFTRRWSGPTTTIIRKE